MSRSDSGYNAEAYEQGYSARLEFRERHSAPPAGTVSELYRRSWLAGFDDAAYSLAARAQGATGGVS